MPRAWDMFKERMHCLPEAAAGLKEIVQEKARLAGWPDGGQTVHRGRPVYLGRYYSVLPPFDFGAGVGQQISPDLKNLTAWFARVDSRASAASSIHEKARDAGMKGVRHPPPTTPPGNHRGLPLPFLSPVPGGSAGVPPRIKTGPGPDPGSGVTFLRGVTFSYSRP